MAFATVNGVRLFHEVSGRGEPIVLIPGLGLDHTYFRYAIPELERHFQVIAYDPRGTGQSDRPAVEYTMELWAADLRELLAQLGIAQAHIVGSSLGGCVALALLRRSPRLAKSLILLAAFAELDRALETNFRMRIAIVEAMGMGPVIRDHVLLWTLSREFIETERGRQAADGLLAALSANDPALYVEFLRSILRFGRVMPGQETEPKFTAYLPEITVPTLVAVGDRDILTPVAFSRNIVERMPDAELAVIERCGHITFIEQPEENTRLIVDFLRRHARGA
jgi:pimeloyl-ACP methyl ester carboxylesterase